MSDISHYHRKPGFEAEDRFNSLMQSCVGRINAHLDIHWYHWNSKIHSDAVFDFNVRTRANSEINLYIDIVGFHYQNGTIRIHTSHKDIEYLLEYCKQEQKKHGFGSNTFKAYFAFYINDTWQFLRVQKSMPKGDIYLSKNRLKGVRSAVSVFGHAPGYKEPIPIEHIELDTETALVPYVHRDLHFAKMPGNITLSFPTDSNAWIKVIECIYASQKETVGPQKANEMIQRLLIKHPGLIVYD